MRKIDPRSSKDPRVVEIKASRGLPLINNHLYNVSDDFVFMMYILKSWINILQSMNLSFYKSDLSINWSVHKR